MSVQGEATFNDGQWAVLEALMDTFHPAVDPSSIAPYVSKRYDVDVAAVAALVPSKTPRFRNTIGRTLASSRPENLKQLRLVLSILGTRPLAIALTGSPTLITDMSAERREELLRSWQHSSLMPLRKLFYSLRDLATTTLIRINPVMYRAMGHPEFEPRLMDFAAKEFYRYEIPSFNGMRTAEINVDVVIVGSGSAAGVVAKRLTEAGVKVLVLEKGKYYHQSEFKFNEDEAFANLYEQSAAMQTADGTLLILSGATLGGGSTVNWSASLRTPELVRKEWVDRGVPWYGERVYDDAMDFVMKEMGCGTDHIKHSFSNRLLLDGAKKLEYKAKEIPQNTGHQPHSCGFCCHGCPMGVKQGAVVHWMYDAAQTGNLTVIDEAEVSRVLHRKDRAVGVDAVVKGHTKLRVRAKTVVSACGSLQTPVLLQRSGFKNKHIGKGLKLHPVTVLFGEFPERDINAFEDSIMTAVVTEFDNLDGQGHGPKIETLLHQPLLMNHFIPWRNGAQARRDLLRYNHLAAMLVITRDRSAGTISAKKDDPIKPYIEYVVNDYDRRALGRGCVGSANIVYIEGASRILPPFESVPPFESSRPKEDRRLSDPDYKAWVKKLEAAAVEPFRTGFGSAHQMASCSMSNKGPSHAAVNANGQLYECSNVFVVDASTFPTASGVNPMISCMATAHVLSNNVLDSVREAPAARL